MKKILIAFALIAGAASAADNVKIPMKPGLWEMKMKTDSSDPAVAAQMKAAQAAMANMPAQQRKAMEAAMKKSGVTLGAGDGSVTAKVCISQEMVDQGALGQSSANDCKNTLAQAGPNTFKMSFNCPSSKVSGDGTYVFAADGSYDIDMKTTSVANGKTQTMNTKGKGTFLGASCGDMKPIAMPK
jgi:hypothetical protein